MTTYEITLFPPIDGEPWRYSVQVSTGFGPNETWATPRIDLVSTDPIEAGREARAAVTLMRSILDA